MFCNLEKFVKILPSLKNYWALGVHKDEVIIGAKIVFLERRTRPGGIFQGPHESNFERELPVYFIASFSRAPGTFAKMLLSHKVPILELSALKAKEIKQETMLKILDDFVQKEFLAY